MSLVLCEVFLKSYMVDLRTTGPLCVCEDAVLMSLKCWSKV